MDSTSDRRPWTRLDWIALALVLIVAIGSLPLLTHPWYDATPDGSVYLVTARALVAGEGYSYLGEPFCLRPPGFSALIAPFVGPGLPDFAAINRAVSATGALTVALFFVYHRARLGALLATLGALVLWAQPGFQHLGNQVMTDVPGAALLLACLLLERQSARSRSLRGEILLGVAIGLSAWVRSALVLLVPAIAISRLAQRALAGRTGSTIESTWSSTLFRQVLPFAAVAALVLLPWSVRNSRLRPPPPADQTWQYTASTLIWNTDPGDPDSPRYSTGEVLARFPTRLSEVVQAQGRLRLTTETGAARQARLGTPRPALGLALSLCLLIVLARRREPGEIFAAGFAFTVCLFPIVFLERYALPVYLFALPAGITVARSIASRAVGPRWAPLLVAPLVALLGLLDFEPRRGWDSIEESHREHERTSAAIAREIEPDARLGAWNGHHLSVFLDRPVWSLRFAVKRAGAAEGTRAVVERCGLDMLVILPGGAKAAEVRDHLLLEYPGARTFDTGGRKGLITRVPAE